MARKLLGYLFNSSSIIDALIDAIKTFQKDNGLTATGKIFPGDATESAINSKFESHGAIFEYPVNTNKNQIAIFDGKTLSLYKNDKKVKSWNGMSGKPDYQGKENQGLKNKGPLPEGTYVARQSKIQQINLTDAALGATRIVGIKAGGWPGSYYSWGKHRVWLEPSQETNTYNRNKFSIHGGWRPGSAGCIDLTDEINTFIKTLENTGKDLVVKVKYNQ